ncbi:synapse-associated protein 1-like isoform X2 [Hypanus sabinus]|uniref:synapse-associated protein 1-like isoform X2 n=1 Tax=Hypanus sabinus TaxID=79690 RepID=UPI0028C3860E|nr:synapse-associated protein 1-like isoform X2 [Hypanus sabinus]
MLRELEDGDSAWWQEATLLVPKEEPDELPPGQGASTAQEPGTGPVLERARGVGSYLRKVATSATKKVSDSMRETAQTIKKSVEEHKIGTLLDMTIIGNFNKEQEKFMKEQKSKKSGSALPPWAGYTEEETVKKQVLSLSSDRRNFLQDPPVGVRFNFDFNTVAPVAMVMLREDEQLSKMRFELVPKLIKEEQFWRNYFYRISFIKRSAQLLSLAAGQPVGSREEPHHLESNFPTTDSELSKTSLVPRRKSKESVGVHPSEDFSISPTVNEFVSDGYGMSLLNQEDVSREMEQLGMSAGQPTPVDNDDIPEWEKELQRELQEFEIIHETVNVSEAWEKEIEALLREED